MKNFAKSILNYFAAFNETRFRFSRKLPYEWTNDTYTLDLSVFPDFQRQLLNFISRGTPIQLEVRKGEYTVELDSKTFKEVLLSRLGSRLNRDFLPSSIEKIRSSLAGAFPEMEPSDLQAKSLSEGFREFNLAFRRLLDQTLTECQVRKIEDLQVRLGFQSVPMSSFNPQRETQRIYDDLQKLALDQTDPETYYQAVINTIQNQDFNFVIFDLHSLLRRYLQLISTQSLYIFFHAISMEEQSYPLFSMEINIRDGEQAVSIETLRNMIMLNTPAINNFQFDSILTTPRACRFEDAASELLTIEGFIQAKYNVSEPFLLSPHFQSLVQEGLPAISFRIGLQAVKEEDRRILDYSELITSLDQGPGRKFIDLISRYVEGNVQNYSDKVHQDYLQNYPRQSVERLVPLRLTIPLSLNETQKKILTAVENEKNELIVVDGPPGTGKSYTITAMVYLAAQMGKSVVITSHKKQALDVIDQFLTEQFKKLHPKSKPSVLRLQRSGEPVSLNNLQNTLSTSVINAAKTRSQTLNQEAVAIDRQKLFDKVKEETGQFWENIKQYDQQIQKTFEWAREQEALGVKHSDQSDALPPRLPENTRLDVERIRDLSNKFTYDPISLSLESLGSLFNKRENLSDILLKCDRLNQLSTSLPNLILNRISSIPPELLPFTDLIKELSKHLQNNIPKKNLIVEDIVFSPPLGIDRTLFPSYENLIDIKTKTSQLSELEGKFLGKVLKKKEISKIKHALNQDHPRILNWIDQEGISSVLRKIKEFKSFLDQSHENFPVFVMEYFLYGFQEVSSESLKGRLQKLSGLEFNPITSLLADLEERPFLEMTLAEIRERLEQIILIDQFCNLQKEIQPYAGLFGLSLDNLPKFYTSVKQAQDLMENLLPEDIKALSVLFQYYGPFLKAFDVDSSDLSTLSKLTADPEKAGHIFKFLQCHDELSVYPPIVAPVKSRLDDYFSKTQKLLELQTDLRFSTLLHHAADIQRIQTAIAAGKQITPDQARIILKNISCIIADPGLIARYFPMEADLFDLLIIDEASQVSIAESISLMLRADQTIVFGDELQYGAVGAVNVSQRYAGYYFKDILRDYALDHNQAISEEEKERISREVSETPAEEEEESSRFIPIEPGTKEWLKTFSIRTSTLAFAKALQNYSESLTVHFRSFPEIISYSNEYFYKESQIELIPNRIRTKPIQEVLRFIPVETKGDSGRNVNLDEIEAIQKDLEGLIRNGYQGTIGVICSFREQTARMEELFRKEMTVYPDLVRNHKFSIWFVGDVQGEERDMVYYSFVQDKRLDNADLRTIYPIIGGTADNIRRLKMQRLNVGFSRAKDIMVFVHSMPISDYSDTRLGDALRHYEKILNTAQDHYIEDESIFGSPAEKELYRLITQTRFFQENQDKLRLIAQFEIGKYIREEYHRYIPNYRVDFLLTKSEAGKEKSLIIEYDGVEFHTKNPDRVTRHNFDQEYLEYDAERQLELESYGYSFLRINKFSLTPDRKERLPVDVLNDLLEKSFR